MVKNLPAVQETWRCRFDPWVQEVPRGKETATHSSILDGEIPWTESLACYSPWGHKELDRTEWLNSSKQTRTCWISPSVCVPFGLLHQCVSFLCADFSSPCAVLCFLAESCTTLCNPIDCSSPGHSVRGDSWSKNLEWVAMPPPRNLPNPGIEPRVQLDSLPSELSYQGALGRFIPMTLTLFIVVVNGNVSLICLYDFWIWTL